MSTLSKLGRAIDATAVFGNKRHLHSKLLPSDPLADQFAYLTTDLSADGTAYLGGTPGIPPSSFPVVIATTSGGGTYYGGQNVAVPATPQAGDLILCLAIINYPYPSVDTPAGYTRLINQFLYSDAAGLVQYKIAAGGETTIAMSSFNTGGNANFGFEYICYLIRGVTGNPEVSSVAAPGGQSSNPPSLTPSWGAKDTLWIVGYMESVSYTPVAPATYGNALSYVVGGNNPAVWSWRKEAHAASDDPASFTNDSPGGVWNASFTIAVRGLG